MDMTADTTTATAPAAPQKDDLLIEVRNLKVNFYLFEGVVRALDGVNFDIRQRRSLGVIGESGCGKSVTAQSIMRIVPTPPARILEGAPLLWLFASGAAIVLLTLTFLSSTTGGKPGEAYRPNVIKDGRIVPAQ